MVQRQQGSYSHSYQHFLGRSSLLQRHPVLTPILLLGSAGVLAFFGISDDTLFPLLTLLGIPSALVCYLLAIVLGVVGVLIGIISAIECIDRYGLRATMFAKSKEHSYANRN